MAIIQPENMNFTGKKFSMIISGSPGTGKTTLALSAPNPILIDFDDGISRVRPQHRTPTIIAQTYEEVLKDLESPVIEDFETIVVDTGGSLITYMSGWAIRKDKKNGQSNGSLSQRGYGAVKKEFQRFTEMLKHGLRKNIIYVFHTVEEKDNDVVKHRLLCEGSSRNIVWQPCDIGCFVYMVNNDRVAGFSPTENYFAKGTYGIGGVHPIPTLASEDNNDMLTRMFGQMKTTIAEENRAFIEMKKTYQWAIETGKALVNNLQTTEDANNFAAELKKIQHSMSSEKEIAAFGRRKILSELGFIYNKATKLFEEAPIEIEEEEEDIGEGNEDIEKDINEDINEDIKEGAY